MAGVVAAQADYADEQVKCRKFMEQFQTNDGALKYLDVLQDIADRKQKLVEICLDDILEHDMGDETLVNAITRNTRRYKDLFCLAIDELIPEPTEAFKPDVFDALLSVRMGRISTPEGAEREPLKLPVELTRRYELSFVPITATKAVAVRQLGHAQIGQLVNVRAMVTRVSDVKPNMSVATYTCDRCGMEVYQTVVSKSFMPEQKCTSQMCKDARSNSLLQLQTRGSKFIKFQEIKLQELPDQVPVGHVPRMLTGYLTGELTRTCAPGDTVKLSGIFLPVPFTGYKAMKAGLLSDTFLEVTKVEQVKQKYKNIELTEEMRERIQQAADEPDTYDRLARSIAPEIFGHLDVKKCLLLLLVGGKDIELEGMRIRGDLHVCLMGDPGVAKSQLLRHIVSTAPRGVFTTGKGSSGVGLTAAIVRDPVTNETILEGGALVLADNGICAIDEFDKMEESDRTSIHEVMEQQTVSIAKAGVTATLNARAAVLAAANPAYGRYNFRKTPSENINMPPALLSRFDILYLIMDDLSKDATEFARHVTHVHLNLEAPPREDGLDEFEPQFLREYIAQARRFNPSIPKALAEYITGCYVNLRSEESTDNARAQFFTTARTLLSILRLSCALARLRFDEEVSQGDVDEAMRLMWESKSSLYELKSTGQKKSKDVIGGIFELIRDTAQKKGTSELKLSDVRNKAASQNFLADQVEECLRVYEALEVWQITGTKDNRKIVFVDQ